MSQASYTGHNSKHSGLQSHSLGELYPLSVAIVESDGRSFCEIRNLISGARYSAHRFEFWDYGYSFDVAHASAESLAKHLNDRQNDLDNEERERVAFWQSLFAACPQIVTNATIIIFVAVVSLLATKLSEDAANDLNSQPIVLQIGE